MQQPEGLIGWAVGPTSIDDRGDRETVNGTLLRGGLGLRVEPVLVSGDGPDIAELEWIVTHRATGLFVARFVGQVGTAIEVVNRIVPLANWVDEDPSRPGLKDDVLAAVAAGRAS